MGPVLHGLDLVSVHVGAHHMAQEFRTGLAKLALAQLGGQLVVSQPLQHYSQMLYLLRLSMLCFCCKPGCHRGRPLQSGPAGLQILNSATGKPQLHSIAHPEGQHIPLEMPELVEKAVLWRPPGF